LIKAGFPPEWVLKQKISAAMAWHTMCLHHDRASRFQFMSEMRAAYHADRKAWGKITRQYGG
jgi:hypothetical protein